ncbi:hypothetical protein SLEP1_g57472 [Rubroshorea leprosula]|uniref:WAT1-related protein n=1 Tax=Rubroshorea leprosula TaxID=152421 RepID=A0AAV5MMQ2_9ROSI|nr:hypothetical protein SLEP1_g57472 [Rubroshorea leprosula]
MPLSSSSHILSFIFFLSAYTESRKKVRNRMLKDFMPCLAMALVQVGYAVMNITSKLAMEAGMKPLVLVAYRQIFSVIVIAPFAFFMER